ncbi:MAG TPA: Xaa-Pro peptidase family protein [bacterium]|nr:Xaa-Pro peptidase family protein [bacterium]
MDYAARIDQTRRRMAAQRIDLLAVSPGDDLRYLCGFSPHADERPCYLLVDPRGAAFVVPSLNAAQAAAHIAVPTFVYTDADGPSAALDGARKALGSRTPARLAVDDTMRADLVLTLHAAYPDATLALGSEVLAYLRMRKSAEEIEALRRSARHADQAVRDAWAACRVGATEQEIADAAAASFKRSGSQEVVFTGVASGPNGAFPHHNVSGRKLAAGDAVTLDLGGRLDGYASDITRMAYVGAPSARHEEIHRTLEAAMQAALAAIRPGVPLKDVDLAARGVIERAGFGEYFIHRLGHGLGISVHELPSVTHLNTLPVEEGFVFSVEPGIYIPGELGARLEEIVYVAKDGAHVLSELPRDVHAAAA